MDFSDLNDSLGQFEGALSGQRIDIKAPEPKTLLLALDGSNQDATALALAGELGRRWKARVMVTIGSEGEATEELRERAEAAQHELAAQPYGVESDVIFKKAPLPAQQILAVQQKLGADLVIVPAPYLRDVGLLGDESLSSPIDMLLAESSAPLLLVRHPLEQPQQVFSRMLIPMTVHVPGLGAAAGWAFKLLQAEGTVELFAVADEAAIEDARALLGKDGELSADDILRAEHRLAGGMTGAVQRKGAEVGATIVVDVAVGKALKLTLGRVHHEPCIVCTAAPFDRTTRAFGRVVNVALGSRYPILIARG